MSLILTEIPPKFQMRHVERANLIFRLLVFPVPWTEYTWKCSPVHWTVPLPGKNSLRLLPPPHAHSSLEKTNQRIHQLHLTSTFKSNLHSQQSIGWGCRDSKAMISKVTDKKNLCISVGRCSQEHGRIINPLYKNMSIKIIGRHEI